MGSLGPRLAKVVAFTLLTFGGIAPAVAAAPASGVVNQAASTPSPGTNEPSERPNVGDEAPGGHEFGEHRNLLSDENGLIALGLAALIGATAAILVMRARRKSSLY